LKTVKLWNVKERAPVGYLEGHTHLVNAVVFSPAGQLLATASVDRTVKLWEPSTRALCCTLKGHSSWVDAVIFSPDGRLLASASRDKTIRLWDVEKEKTIRIFDTGETIKTLFLFSSNSPYLITDQKLLHLDRIHPSRTQQPSKSPPFSVFKESWVVWNPELILWLPADYRPTHLTFGGNVLAITYKSGHLFYIEFDPSCIEKEIYGTL
jgi:WD40 repeat protein